VCSVFVGEGSDFKSICSIRRWTGLEIMCVYVNERVEEGE